MTLEEFKTEVATDLDSFVSWWLLKRAKDMKNLPDEMGAGDWWEQFMMRGNDNDND